MKKIDDLIEEYVNEFNNEKLPELNEDRETVLFDLSEEDIKFNEKAFLDDLLQGDLKLFKDYICNDFDELSTYIDDDEIVDHVRTYDEITSKGHKENNRYLEKLPDYDEQQKAYRDEIAIALKKRAGGDGEVEALMDDYDIKNCVLDEDFKLNFGMSESELIMNNTIQMYNCLIYLMGNEVKNKIDDLTIDDIKNYCEINRDDLNKALEQQTNQGIGR